MGTGEYDDYFGNGLALEYYASETADTDIVEKLINLMAFCLLGIIIPNFISEPKTSEDSSYPRKRYQKIVSGPKW